MKEWWREMILFITIGIIWIYYTIASFTINKVYEKTQSIKYKRVAIAIFLLIPTWDIIIGYPVYQYYCYTQSGEKIYKTVENVDGVYVGEYDTYYYAYCDFYTMKLFNLYSYIDHKDTKTGNYFRGYKLDTNTSSECLQPANGWSKYSDIFKNGQCVRVVQIPENSVSRWELLEQKEELSNIPVIPLLGIVKHTLILVRDRKANKILTEDISIGWTGGKLYSSYMGLMPGHEYDFGCSDDGHPLYIKDPSHISFIRSILKPSKKDN